MEDYFDKKTREFGEYCTAVSFQKDGDNYYRLRELLVEVYQEGRNDQYNEIVGEPDERVG